MTLPEGEFDATFDAHVVKRLTDVLVVSHEKRRKSSMPVLLRALMPKRMNRVRG